MCDHFSSFFFSFHSLLSSAEISLAHSFCLHTVLFATEEFLSLSLSLGIELWSRLFFDSGFVGCVFLFFYHISFPFNFFSVVHCDEIVFFSLFAFSLTVSLLEYCAIVSKFLIPCTFCHKIFQIKI